MRNGIRETVVIVLLIAATLAAYWPVRNYSFIEFDDPLYVTGNDQVKKGLNWEGVKYAFTTGDASNWHPLTWLSHMLDSQLFGHKQDDQIGNDPRGHHMMSVGFHAANVVLLFLLLQTTIGRIWLSAFVAAAFALHPLRIESVAWIAERKDVLSTFFGLLAILAYVSYSRRGSLWRYVLVAICMACSLMCKPMFVTLPFLLLLLDYWPLKRIGVTEQPSDGLGGVREPVTEGPGWSGRVAWPLILEKLPLLALSIASSTITIIAQQKGGSVETSQTLPLLSRLGNALVSYSRYLWKTFWPSDLALVYPHPGSWPWWAVLGSAALLVVVTVMALSMARKHPYFIVGWSWFVGTLVPVIGVIQVGTQSMADRYTYVPHIGLIMAIACLTVGVLGKARGVLTAGYAVIVLAALWFVTAYNLPFWANTEKVYRRALQVTDRNWVIEYNLGVVLMGQVTGPEQRHKLVESGEHFARAAQIQPGYALAHFMVADNQIRLGRTERGLAGFRHVLTLDPEFKEAMNNLAWFLATHPDPKLRNGAEAVKLAERACELGEYKLPSELDTLAAAYAEVGRFDDAIRTALDAVKKARELKQDDLAKTIETEIEKYRAGQPLGLEVPKSETPK